MIAPDVCASRVAPGARRLNRQTGTDFNRLNRQNEKLAKIGEFAGKWLPGMTWEKGNGFKAGREGVY